MTIHVTITEAEKRLAELFSAAQRGERVVLSNDGAQVSLVPLTAKVPPTSEELEGIAASRKAAMGMYAKEAEGFDLSIEALKADRMTYDERWERKFGAAD